LWLGGRLRLRPIRAQPPRKSRVKLTLYSKPGCHLCEALRAFVDELQPTFGFDIEEVDIRRDAELFTRYRYEIPVLFVDGEEVSRGTVSEREIVARLKRVAGGQVGR
jgi:glutaredoxin